MAGKYGSTLLVSMFLIILFFIPQKGYCQKMNQPAHTNGIVALPAPEKSGKISIESAIFARRSIRSFEKSALSMGEIGQILFAAQGVTDEQNGFRAAPSAGATYPLETYCITPDAVFKYSPKRHALKKLKQGNHRNALSRAALGQACVELAPCSIIFTAIMERTTGRYGKRGIRYVHLEAGHAAQNIHLQAVALGLGSVPVGAFEDDSVKEVLGCGENEVPLYIVSIGRPKR